MTRLIVFLIRKRLGLKRGEKFRFANQASSHNYYYFTKDRLMKVCWPHGRYVVKESDCRLNWLLDDDCKIVKVEE